MGLWSWLFPSPEQRLERARAKLARGRFAEARLDALDLGDLPGAAEVVAEAETGLARLNLEAAVSWVRGGEPDRARQHLELARKFAVHADLSAEFEATREKIAAIEAERAAEVRRAAETEARRLLEVSEGFRSELAAAEIPLPEGISPEEVEAIEARLAIYVDAWPEDLRERILRLGAPFVRAVLDREDGKAQEALDVLLTLPDDDPVVLHERARAAHALGHPEAAARAWRQFAEKAGGHRRIGTDHTGVLLAGALAEAGHAREALAVLEPIHREDPAATGMLWPLLLEANGKFAAAEQALRDLLQRHGGHPRLYEAIARVRLKGGHRVAAMQALEKSVEQACRTGGCAHHPPDLAVYRMLATLYLEDGLETERALELAETAASLVKEPVWEDVYLRALVAKARGEEGWNGLAEQLVAVLPPEDPRHGRVAAHLA